MKNNKMIQSFAGGKFLSICILVTVSTALGLTASPTQLNIFSLLIAIYGWLLYGKARQGELEPMYMRGISGTIYAVKVLCIVGLVFMLLGALALLLCIAIPGMLSVQHFIAQLAVNVDWELKWVVDAMEVYGVMLMLVAGLVALVVASGVMLVVIHAYGRVHGFAKSLYQNAQNSRTPVLFADKARTWLIVMAVFSGISALSSLAYDLRGGIAECCSTAALILGAILIGEGLGKDAPSANMEYMEYM